MSSTIIDGMAFPKTLPDAADTDNALAAVLALRRAADTLEQQAVALALGQGWSWSQIAEALGVSKQAAHRRLSSVPPRPNRDR